MRIRYSNDYGIKCYVHSYRKVFEELPEGLGLDKRKKSGGNNYKMFKDIQNEKRRHLYSNNSNYQGK